MKKVAIFTSSRSDFGLLRRVIELCSYVFDLDLLILGSHNSNHQQNEHEIAQQMHNLAVGQVHIAFTLEDLSHQAQCQAIAQAQHHLASHLAQQRYDLFLVLGDRWELFSASVPAFLFNIPIAHLHGGEITLGAIDDSVRHAHTKMANLHFVANASYAKNLSLMGEEDWRITVSGACGLDQIYQSDRATPEGILKEFGINLANPVILVTCHPSTRELNITAEQQIDSLLDALALFSHYTIVFTAPGLESGAELIITRIKQFVESAPHRHYVASFGNKNYLTVLQHAKVIVGNSSSGLVEAASLGVPCVNVGRRQEGRLAAPSVLHASYASTDIAAQIDKALSEQFQLFSKQCENPSDPYRDGRNSDRIVYALQRAIDTVPHEKLIQKKLDFSAREHDWNILLKGYK